MFDEYGLSKLEPAEGKSELNNKVCELKYENGKLKAELMRLELVIETLRNAVTELAKIALEYNCAICCTLHTNPGDENKMRGHLGTMLAQKASDVIQCVKTKKEDGTVVFEVEQTENRNNADFSKFAFAIEMRKDVSGELIAVPVKSYVSVKEKSSLDDLFRWALYNNPMRRADLKDKIISDDCPHKVSRSTAYQRINEALAAGIIADDDPVTHRLRYVGLKLPNEDEMPF